MDFLPAILLGFMWSLHCLGMCGPIAFMLPLNRQNHWKGGFQIVSYHAGRLGAYLVLGLLFGILGRGIAMFGVQQKISVIIGILMILSVLIPFRARFVSGLAQPAFKLGSVIRSRLGRELGRRGPDTFLLIGFLNGLLPCGLVYLAVLGAIAMGHPVNGALFMLSFGLGTIPMMSAAAYLGNFAKASVRRRIRQLIPIVVVLVGILFVLRGMGLGIPYLSPAPVLHVHSALLDCQN